MDGHNKNAGVTCCFCNKDIQIQGKDPCDITIAENWTNTKQQRQDQFFWCHLECFRNSMHPNLKMYLCLDLLGEEE